MNLVNPYRFCLILIFALFAHTLADVAGPSLSPYIRYDTGKAGVDTSILTYRNSKGQTVDLVSAVHVAAPTYYSTLNKRFRSYDAVLYELVLPDEMVGQRLPSELDTDSGVSGLQSMIARSLGLSTQLAKVDYSPVNFVHADLTQNGLSQRMAQRKESLLSYLMKVMASSNSIDQNALGVSEQELAQLDFNAMLSGRTSAADRRTLRKLLAATLTQSGGVLHALGDTAIIAERNKAALKVLDREVADGKQRLALFYGAAHMPDLQKQLEQKGWRKTGEEWIRAWDI